MKYLPILALLLTHFATTLTAQKTWSVDLSRTRPSLEAIRLEQIDLTDKNTVVYMSYWNTGRTTTFIEVSNTFFIRANGKRVAEFIKVEGAPMTDQRSKDEFECADPTTAMRVRYGERVFFRIFFEKIPTDLQKIDIIEFDGTRSCEFDVFNLNITQKEALKPFAKYDFKDKTVARTTPATPKKTPLPVSKPKKPTPKPTDPSVAAKENAKPKPTEPAVKPIEKRVVTVKERFEVKIGTIELEIWDNDREDGDAVTVTLNGRKLMTNYALSNRHKKIQLSIKEGKNTLTLHADNLGSMPPNTASLSFFDGEKRHYLVLTSDFETSQSIEFVYKKR